MAGVAGWGRGGKGAGFGPGGGRGWGGGYGQGFGPGAGQGRAPGGAAFVDKDNDGICDHYELQQGNAQIERSLGLLESWYHQKSMNWHRWITLGGFLLALAALAAWQWDEYGHECDLARETVSSAADSVMNVLVGGVRSHRRLGPSFSENIQAVLDGLVHSKDVRAVALVSKDGKMALLAGETKLLDLQPPFSTGEHWDEAGFRLVKTFSLPVGNGRPG